MFDLQPAMIIHNIIYPTFIFIS